MTAIELTIRLERSFLIFVFVGINEKPLIIRHFCDYFRYQNTLVESAFLQIFYI